jgi:hypothetical protein
MHNISDMSPPLLWARSLAGELLRTKTAPKVAEGAYS